MELNYPVEGNSSGARELQGRPDQCAKASWAVKDQRIVSVPVLSYQAHEADDAEGMVAMQVGDEDLVDGRGTDPALLHLHLCRFSGVENPARGPRGLLPIAPPQDD
eukprot:306151-Hanusia_phi.AAC.2